VEGLKMSLYEDLLNKKEKLSLIGLGYVGMPIAVSFSQKVNVIGFDSIKVNEILEDVDLVVNTTSQGMHGTVSQLQDMINWDCLRKEAVISDIVYKPLITPFLSEAVRHGLKIVTGENMLLYQGVLAYELWIGRKAPVCIMRNAIIKALSEE
jgi:shikimate dehydrogenase